MLRYTDLHNVREFLIHALGPDFTRSALENGDNYVSARVSNDSLHSSTLTSHGERRCSERLPHPHLPPQDWTITCMESHARTTSAGCPTYLPNRSASLLGVVRRSYELF